MRLLLALALALPVAAQGQDIDFRIRLKQGQTRFHLGETIPLELMFSSASPDKYSLDMRLYDRVGRQHFTDEFRVEPVEGTSDPLRNYFPGGSGLVGMGGLGGIAVLGQKPVSIGRDLNEWIRIDKPGQYRTTVLSRRVSAKRAPDASSTPPVELTSNTVNVTVLPADPQWEAAELKRAVEVLETVLPGPDSGTSELRRSAARQIRFLNTPNALRQCVRWFRGTDPQLDSEFRFCLLGATHRVVAAEAMAQALAEPGQPISAGFVETLAKLKTWLERGATGAYPQAEPAQAQWREEQKGRYEYEMKTLAALTDQLAAAAARKEGAAKALSLRALTDLLTQAKREVPDQLRGDLAASFTDLPSMQQSEILGYRWDAVKTTAMIPTLRKILDDPPEGHPELRDLALRRLYEIDPTEGRRLILADIERPEPRFGFQVLAMLPDQTLPSVESAVLRNVERTRSWIGRELIARYGSKAILPRVEALYESMSEPIDKQGRARPGDTRNLSSPACEPALIAYLLRVDPAYGEAKLRKALTERGARESNCHVMIIPQTAHYYAGPEWEKVAIEALQDPAVEVKMFAAKALGEHGSAAAEKPLFSTFEYWHNWWKDRPSNINDQNRFFEQELVRAVVTGKGWKLDTADFTRLEDLCLTQQCKNEARSYAQQAMAR